MTSYILLRVSKTDTATYYNTSSPLNLRLSMSVDWKTIRRALEAGMMIIGQVAGHEINLEKEDVLDKKRKKKSDLKNKS